MKKRNLFMVLTLLTVVGATSAATVRAVRCDGGHVRLGDDKYAVLEKCGSPKYTEIVSGDRDPKRERLIFKIDSNSSYLTAFEFRGGELESIKEIRTK